jgi:hypothetical protein
MSIQVTCTVPQCLYCRSWRRLEGVPHSCCEPHGGTPTRQRLGAPQAEKPNSVDRWLIDHSRGSVPVAVSQPMAAMRALTILARPSPMPAAAAQSRASGHENRGLVGSKRVAGAVFLRTA